MNLTKTIISAILGGLALSWAIAALVARDPAEPNREIFTEMQYSVAAESQAKSEVLPGGLVEQPPPEGTYYRGQKAYLLPALKLNDLKPEDLVRVRNNTGPYVMLNDEKRAAVAAAAEPLFVKNCQSCHGVKGGAGAPVAAFGIGATNLPANTGKYSDGELFHLITYGVRTMPGHAALLKTDDRWKVILYLRKLQGGRP